MSSLEGNVDVVTVASDFDGISSQPAAFTI